MTEERQNCKFFLLRYAPDAVKGEFINIGLVLLSAQAPPELRFAKDWARAECLNPNVDLEMLTALREEIAREVRNDANREAVLRMMEEFSNSLQASEYQACRAENPAQEADKLAKMYLETSPHPRAHKKTEQTIYERMQQTFEQTGVWKGMKHKIAASDYGIPGDPLRIDCGYQVNSTLKMFHSTPLRANVNAAKVLAFSYPEFAAGIRRKQAAQAILTAVIEDNLEKNDQIDFALGALEQHAIHVATVADLPVLAATAARDMGLA
jgi:hypothetical protein